MFLKDLIIIIYKVYVKVPCDIKVSYRNKKKKSEDIYVLMNHRPNKLTFFGQDVVPIKHIWAEYSQQYIHAYLLHKFQISVSSKSSNNKTRGWDFSYRINVKIVVQLTFIFVT